MSADIVKPLDRRHQPVEVVQPNVALANLAGTLACHETIDARTSSNASDKNAGVSQFSGRKSVRKYCAERGCACPFYFC